MDVIRTPYRRKARIFRDSSQEVTLSWYPAPPGAKWFPYSHLFGSADWQADTGEVKSLGDCRERQRQWTTGQPLPTYLGQCFAGPLDWYQNGVPFAEANEPGQLPPCCGKPTKQTGWVAGGTAHVARGNNARLQGLALGGTSRSAWGRLTPVQGGIALGGSATVKAGRRTVEAGGVACGGVALVLAGRGGWGVLYGGMGPGGWLLAGMDPVLQGGVSLDGEVEGEDAPDNSKEGGVLWGGTALANKVPENEEKGGVVWTARASVKTYDPVSVFIPGCGNRIPRLLRGVIDQCTGSLTPLAGTRTFGWTTGYVWTCPVPGIGAGQLLLTLDLSPSSLSLAKLTCNCFLGTQPTPINAACYPFRVEWSVSVGAFQLLCTIRQVFSSFHLVVTPFPP